MDIRGTTFVVIGGACLIGSHLVDYLTREDVRKIIVYDNFARGTIENLNSALGDPRVRIFEADGDITQTDVLHAALDGANGVFHLAALWLLQCHEFPRAAFDVNIRGTFNVMEACVTCGVKRLVYSSSAAGVRLTNITAARLRECEYYTTNGFGLLLRAIDWLKLSKIHAMVRHDCKPTNTLLLPQIRIQARPFSIGRTSTGSARWQCCPLSAITLLQGGYPAGSSESMSSLSSQDS